MITVSGIGSGLDVEGIVTQLVAAERQPAATRLDRREAGLQAKISALGALKSALSEFNDSTAGLSKLSTFNAPLPGWFPAPGCDRAKWSSE